MVVLYVVSKSPYGLSLDFRFEEGMGELDGGVEGG